MRFMILRKADKNTEAGLLPEVELISAMGQYNAELMRAGIMRAGEGLHSSANGVRLKLSDGKVSVIDGPFSETRELIAGFSIIEVESKQEAIEWVKRWPPLDGGGNVEIEIRETGCSGGCERLDAPAGEMHPQEGMRFIVLLKADCNTEADIIPDRKLLDAMMKRNEADVKAGILQAGEGLQPSAKGARVKFTGGQPSVIDGPFTEIKELIAGFFIIRAKSRQDAVEWARHHPYPLGAEVEVEIRQVYQAEDFGEAFTLDLREAEQRMRGLLLESGMQLTLSGTTGARS